MGWRLRGACVTPRGLEVCIHTLAGWSGHADVAAATIVQNKLARNSANVLYEQLASAFEPRSSKVWIDGNISSNRGRINKVDHLIHL